MLVSEMTDDQINAAIHYQVLGHQQDVACHSPITINMTVSETPGLARWTCTACSAAGEYSLHGQLLSTRLDHIVQPPNYLHSTHRAAEVLHFIGTKKDEDFQQAFDFAWLGATSTPRNGRNMLAMISEGSLVSRLAQALEPEAIIHAAIAALHATQQKGDQQRESTPAPEKA